MLYIGVSLSTYSSGGPGSLLVDFKIQKTSPSNLAKFADHGSDANKTRMEPPHEAVRSTVGATSDLRYVCSLQQVVVHVRVQVDEALYIASTFDGCSKRQEDDDESIPSSLCSGLLVARLDMQLQAVEVPNHLNLALPAAQIVQSDMQNSREVRFASHSAVHDELQGTLQRPPPAARDTSAPVSSTFTCTGMCTLYASLWPVNVKKLSFVATQWQITSRYRRIFCQAHGLLYTCYVAYHCRVCMHPGASRLR